MATFGINMSEMNICDKIDRFVVGEIVYKEGSTFGPRIQGGVQAMYVYSGSARILIDGKERVIEAGEATLLLPDHVEHFEFSGAEPTHHGWCTAIGSGLVEWASEADPTLSAVWPLPPMVRVLTDRGIALRNQPGGSAQALYRQIAMAIFHEYFHAAGYPAQPDLPLAEPVRRACDWINVHYAESCTLEDLGRAAGITGAHLIRLFKQHLDTTPIRRLWTVRYENGRRLLVETGLSVAEVAYRCGYQTPYHFSREFKARGGMSPRDYRNGKWQR